MSEATGATSPTDVVQQFLGLLANRQADQAVALLDPAVEWRNSGCPTIRGRRVVDALRAMEKRHIRFSADMHHIAADGDAVLTERTDHLGIGRFVSSFWVCGTFEVRAGRITLWDDHFSAGNVLLGSLRGLVGMLGGRGA